MCLCAVLDRRLLKSAQAFHRGTLLAPELQDAEDRRLEERENKEKAQLIPRKIWQRCLSFPPQKVEKCYIKSWRDNNPDYEHSVLGDEDALRFVEQAYPALKRAYLSLRCDGCSSLGSNQPRFPTLSHVEMHACGVAEIQPLVPVGCSSSPQTPFASIASQQTPCP